MVGGSGTGHDYRLAPVGVGVRDSVARETAQWTAAEMCDAYNVFMSASFAARRRRTDGSCRYVPVSTNETHRPSFANGCPVPGSR